MVAEFNDKAGPSVQRHGVYQVGPLRIHLYHHIRGFHFKGSAAGYVIHQKGSVLSCGSVVELVKIRQLFFLHAAFFQEILYLLLVQHKRLRDFFMFIDHFRQVFVNAFDHFIFGVFSQRFRNQGLEGFLLAPRGERQCGA